MSELPLELQSADKEKLKQIFGYAKAINILVTGKAGSGKSTLINGILGVKINGEKQAKEGCDIYPCTTTLKAYQAKKGNIVVTVWESPGLQNGTGNDKEYLKQMKEKCSERDFTIYCIKICDMRLVRGSDEYRAMDKLTATFGPEFWETTIVALTFANIDWEFLSEREKPQVFEQKIKQWKARIQAILINEIKVPKEIARVIRIVPAGHYRKPHLPGLKFWLSNLWFNCVETISTTEGRTALLE